MKSWQYSKNVRTKTGTRLRVFRMEWGVLCYERHPNSWFRLELMAPMPPAAGKLVLQRTPYASGHDRHEVFQSFRHELEVYEHKRRLA